MAIAAFLLGILGASSLALGAILGVAIKPHPQFSAAVMAFGSGTLLSAIAFEITHKVYLETNFITLALGFATGGILFTQISHYIDQHGGFLRKPASIRRYLVEHRQEINREILKRIAHVEVLRDLPEAEKAAISSLVTPICVLPGEILCREGEMEDVFYMIAILSLWFGMVLLSGFVAMGGFWLQGFTSEAVIAFAQAIAGGAILAMLASTMMPEAYELGGNTVSYATIAGFLLGFFVNVLHS